MASSVPRLAKYSDQVFRLAFTPLPKPSSFFLEIPSMFHFVHTASSEALRTVSASEASETKEARLQRLQRIADEVLNLDKIEYQDYVALLRKKLCTSERKLYSVKLEKIDPESKLNVVRVMLDLPELDLKEVSEIIDELPSVVKRGLTKEQAEILMGKLREAGATVVME